MQQVNFLKLKEKYETLLSNIDKANQIKPLTSITKQEIHEIEDWIKRLKQPKFYIVFTGTFNAGKSTIINAFLNRLLLPLSNKPWTAKATTIQKSDGEKEGFIVVKKDGSEVAYDDVSRLANFVSNQTQGNLTDIESVKVFIKDLPFDDDIVLVDTPGFDVANEDHKKTTKEFTTMAHACVVCFDIGLIDSSDQNSLVNYLSSNKALTAERRFWAINKWDTKSDEQQSQGESSFYTLLKRNNLNDSPSRLHKISAGTFLAGELSSNNTRTHEEEKFIAEINLNKYQYTNEVKIDFRKFRDDIVNFLQSNAKRDFYLKAEQEFTSKLKKLESEFNSMYSTGEDEKSKTERVKRRISLEEGDKNYQLFEAIFERFIEQFKTAKKNNDFWSESYIADINEQIMIEANNKLSVAKLDEDFLPRLQYNPFEIVSKLLKVIDYEIVSTIISKHAKDTLYNKYTYSLFSELRDIYGRFLPETISQSIEEVIELKNLTLRIKGMVDSVFYNYTEAATKEIVSLLPGDRPQDKDAEDYKMKYGPLVIQYLQEIVKTVIGNRLVSLLHSYFGDVIRDLKSIMLDNKSLIISNISDEHLNMNDKIQQYLREQELFNEIKHSLDKLK